MRAVWRKARIRFPRLRNVQKIHLGNGNPAISYFRRKFFMYRNVVKNCHYVNDKPVVSPEARIRFPRLLNVQKWSLS